MPKIVHCGLNYSGGGGGGGGAISELSDVELTDLSDGEILKYDSQEEKWVNAEDGGGEANFIYLTQAEYNELSYAEKHDPDKMYMITDGPEAEAQYFDPIIYSETEREVGVWTDGKPLYQKTIRHNTAMTHRTWVTIVDDSTISIKRYDGYLYLNGEIFSSIDYYRGVDPNEYCCSAVGNDGSLLNVWPSIGSSYTITCEITIWYTKVADTPGSGKYTSLGVPSVHYSTAEQVIGTWIDGKTLYQKTLVTQNSYTITTSGSWVTTDVSVPNGFETVIKAEIVNNYLVGIIGVYVNPANGNVLISNIPKIGDITVPANTPITIQYTKTTD